MNQTLLTLICPPSIERTLVDWLLEQPEVSGFTSSEVYGHGSYPEKLNLIEQVEGRKKQVKFQLHLELDSAMAALKKLKIDLKGADVHYWLLPITESGRV